MSLAWRQPASVSDALSDRDPMHEHIVQLTLRTPRIAQAPRVARAPSPSRITPQFLRAPEEPSASRDTGSAAASIERAFPPDAVAETPASATPMSPSMSSRLRPTSSAAAPWYSAPRARNPFVRGEQVFAAERDSTLGELGQQVPRLAAERVVPRSEVDARAKEAMLKMRLSGRILLVPPDNSGGLITMSVPLPFLGGGGPSKAAHARSSAARSAAQLIQERLRERADSVKRARADSVARRVGGP